MTKAIENIEPQGKYFAFDVETTGLDPRQCAIISIGFVVLDDKLNPIDNDEFYVQPFEGAIIEPKAIEINGYSHEKWDEKGAIDQEELLQRLDNALMYHTFSGPRTASKNQIFGGIKKLIPLGYNVSFDLKFLKEFFVRHEESIGRYLESDAVCVLKEVKKDDKSKQHVEPDGHKLSNTCKRFEITNDNPHQALSDIRATIEVYKKLKEQGASQ